jgi:diaminopropionate ammonia-lyase
MLLIDEALEQMPSKVRPSHVFLQGGVGGLAAAVIGYLWERWGGQRPRVVIIEPMRADCIYRSIAAGERTRVPGDFETFMACLAAAEVSPPAWEILKTGADDVVELPDASAAETMRILATGVDGDQPLVAGESGCAATAGLIAVALDDRARTRFGLDTRSVVLVVGSEGATDAETFARIVGEDAETVLRRAALRTG